jgi:DNA-binding transcriptional LysR family regulator
VREYTEVADKILNRESDLGITELSEFIENDELRLEPLGQHRGVFLCRPGHPLLDQSVVTSDTLLDYPWCCTRMPSRFRAALPGDLRRAGSYDPITRELVPAIEINNISDVAPIIAGSDAICPTALLMFRSEIETGKLSVVPFFEPWMVTNYGFVYLKHRNLPFSVEAYMKIVRDVESLLFNEEKSFAETIRQQ